MKRKKDDDGDTTVTTFTTVVCKIGRLHIHPALLDEIDLMCSFLQQVRLESTHLANLHLIRCCEEGHELPQPKQAFFYQCCARVADTKSSGDLNLDETLRIYRSSRATVDSYPGFRSLSDNKFAFESTFFNDLARDMLTNAAVMISTTFYRRLYQYVRFGGPTIKTTRDAGRLTRSVFKKDGGFDEAEQQLRDWIGFVPTKATIKTHLAFFVHKCWEMLRVIELYSSTHPRTRGVKTYTFLPLSTSGVVSHITINASTLHALCARVFQREKINVLGVPQGSRNNITSTRYFATNRAELMRAAFAVKLFETGTRHFAFQISTNGYSASVLLTRPTKPSRQASEDATKRQRTSINQSVSAPSSLPSCPNAVVSIGVDPGVRKLCTAAIVGEDVLRVDPSYRRLVRQERRRRAQKRKKRTHTRSQALQDERKHRRRRNFDGKRFVSVSAKEFRHLAGSAKHRIWHENLKATKRGYRIVQELTPSFKTANFTLFLGNLKSFWSNLKFLLRFSAKHSFLKWRFFQYTMKQKALHLVSKRLVPISSNKVNVGYGDWSKRDRIKGQPSTPVLGFARALTRRCTVVSVDEYRTSKLCSQCYGPLKKTVVPGTRKTNRNILRCKSSECGCQLWDRDVNAALNILHLHQVALDSNTRSTPFCRSQQ